MPLVLKSAEEKPLESKCSTILKLERSLQSSSKSMEFRCLATLVVQWSHRISQTATSELAMKTAAEGYTPTLIQMLFSSNGLDPHYRRQLSGPLSLQSRPIYAQAILAQLPDWPRFVFLNFSTSPLNWICLHVDRIEQGLHPRFVSSNPLIGFCNLLKFSLALNPYRVLLSANLSWLLPDEIIAMKEFDFAISASSTWLANCSRIGNLTCYMPVDAFIETKNKQFPITFASQSRIQLSCQDSYLRDTDSQFSASTRLLPDLEGLPSPCFLSFLEHLVKDSLPTSQDQEILTIHQFFEAFVEMISTHLWITGGKSLCCSCLQALMVLLLNFGFKPIYPSLANLNYVFHIVSSQEVDDFVSVTPFWD